VSSYRIILADDHAMLRQGIKGIIGESEEVEISGEASDGAELLKMLDETPADMIILDISMPGIGGIEATKRIKESHPDVKILILSMHKEKEYLYHALAAGADGYLLKEDTGSELFTAIETVRGGANYLSTLFSKEVAEDLISFYRGEGTPPLDSLTNREREILSLVAEGKTSKEIAEHLYISVRTVEHHRASITKKLGAGNVADLVKYAIRKGYTTPTD
jgi:DNA-binding NarL/FixJ family response regulator